MSATRSYLSGVAYSTGQPIAIDSLFGPADPQPPIPWSDLGFHAFCEDPRPIPEMWMATVAETFRRTARLPDVIDAVVGVSSPAHADVLFDALHSLGIRRAFVLGLTLQECSGASSAIRVATDLIGTGRHRHVLVVQCGKWDRPEHRVDTRRGLVFSDGAASCIVSSAAGAFEILASDVLAETGLTGRSVGRSVNEALNAIKLLRRVIGGALEAANVSIDAVRAVFSTAGNAELLMLAGTAAGLPTTRMYRGGLARRGHVFGCDGLIDLRDFVDERQLDAGDCVLLCSWSSHVVGATVLRYLGEEA